MPEPEVLIVAAIGLLALVTAISAYAICVGLRNISLDIECHSSNTQSDSSGIEDAIDSATDRLADASAELADRVCEQLAGIRDDHERATR